LKAVLEHIFDEHKYCDVEWCLALKAKEQVKAYNPSTPWLSFITQTNEALNNSQAVVTPKVKFFHKTRSIHYCHAIVVSTHNWGHAKY